MHWTRKPRLYSAVATVAVEMVFSLLRVASLSFVILFLPELVDRRLSDRRAEIGLEEIEVAAFIGLADMAGEHPAIAALEAGLWLLPRRAALCHFGL